MSAREDILEFSYARILFTLLHATAPGLKDEEVVAVHRFYSSHLCFCSVTKPLINHHIKQLMCPVTQLF